MLRIQRVTEDYLKFARMPKPRRERVSLNELLDHGLSFMKSLFAATGVTVNIHIDKAWKPPRFIKPSELEIYGTHNFSFLLLLIIIALISIFAS